MKIKILDIKRKERRTSGRIGEARLAVETTEADLEVVGVVFMARIEEEEEEVSEVAGGDSAVAGGDLAEAGGDSAVAEEALGIVMGVIISEGEGGEVLGAVVVVAEIGEVLGRVLVKEVREVSEVVKMLEDTRRGTRLVAMKTRKSNLTTKFEGKLMDSITEGRSDIQLNACWIQSFLNAISVAVHDQIPFPF